MSSSDQIREVVRERYGEIARSGGSCCGPASSCDSGNPTSVALAVGYSKDDLAQLPDGANLGLSCGNPIALAELQPSEVVLDLGSGAGFDVFQAGPRVGASGRAIGVDMTADMVSRARGNLPAYRTRTGLDNVEFRLGEIEHLPVGDATVDVVLSNCVINLSPDKPQVWREIARVLKPGGRVSVSDIALHQPLPESLREQALAWSGCVAGAETIAAYESLLVEAGFTDIRLTPKTGFVHALLTDENRLAKDVRDALPEGATPEDYLVSLNIEALRSA